jgi:hypothetical protein
LPRRLKLTFFRAVLAAPANFEKIPDLDPDVSRYGVKDPFAARAPLLVLLLAFAFAPVRAAAQDAPALRARHDALLDRLTNNQFHRRMVVESTQTSATLKGDVYTVVAQPYSSVNRALREINPWCDILMLHLNVKSCLAKGRGAASTLSLLVGRRFDQPLADTYPLDFAYRVAANTRDYLQVLLSAEAGPLDTKNYSVVVEAVALDAIDTFVHLSYSYTYGLLTRVAMQSYLRTIGRNKVGFSIVDRKADGTPVFIGGTRGVVERNAMRYYLAIEAYLGAIDAPAAEQPEKRLRDWFDAIEHYPRQLHEMEREEYLSMKRLELARQKSRASRPN